MCACVCVSLQCGGCTHVIFLFNEMKHKLFCVFSKNLVGSLVYLDVTRPDISHLIHILSQFTIVTYFEFYDIFV